MYTRETLPLFQKVSYNDSIIGNSSKHRICFKRFRSEQEIPIMKSFSLALALFFLSNQKKNEGKSVIYLKKTVHSKDTVLFPLA